MTVFFVTFLQGYRPDSGNRLLKNVSKYSKPGCYSFIAFVENYGAGLSFFAKSAKAQYICQPYD